ncbi:Rpn family recombination-promoting nuclease/putative transposase [Nodularia sp. UHCC 0506]|uniref:Rpn family recombination-promoting nuclease/putative transposase n=1 Tax=Nodularia sp. UHCC 0506 TaxID=3110243 RepID=UPI002B214329|nr:Rpn family recombination-promoting nuclease/putative transposase [Nodularia sp. UHCC 0506]MEA5515999.1 Rpn family recombination-promoting nuclease/putative transposase [Nodularia sp. UHCC 0506]
MKTDSILYRLFKTFPGIFFELLGQSPVEAEAYEFLSVEVKQTTFRIDGAFLPKQPDLERPIHFTEFQFQPDTGLYSRLLTEIFMYLDKTEIRNDWRGTVIWMSRRLDPGIPIRYWEFFESQRVQVIYLDELRDLTNQSIGLGTLTLVVEPPEQASVKARSLIERSRQVPDEQVRRKLVELIETIIVYKFPHKSQAEIQAMLGLGDLKQTRVYQEGLEDGERQGRVEGKLEGKLEAVPRLLKLGLTLEQVAEALELDIAEVRKAARV